MSAGSLSARSRHNRSLIARATTASTLLLMAALAMADPLAEPRPGDDRVARVSLADLDLATAQGARVARQRVTAAAQRLCWQLGDSTRTSNRATVSACVRDTIAETMKAIAPSQVAALSDKP
jgi:UrcA family protein